MIPLTDDEARIGRALNSIGAQFSIAPAADGQPVAHVYVSGVHVASIGGTSVAGLLRNLARLAELTAGGRA